MSYTARPTSSAFRPSAQTSSRTARNASAASAPRITKPCIATTARLRFTASNMKDIPKYLASTAFGALIGSLIAGQSVLSLILVAGLALIGAVTWIGYRIMRDPERKSVV